MGNSHRKKKAGPKAEKRKKSEKRKKQLEGGPTVKGTAGNNPRAFAMQSTLKAKIMNQRKEEKLQKRLHAPMVEKAVDEPPPYIILVQGPPGVGKTSIIRSLIRHYTRQTVSEVLGPITVVVGKTRRLMFIECPQDLNGMMDAAKIADLVLCVIDGSFGFEMETFEFLNLLQVHGFPKVMGVLTHLDRFKDPTKLKEAKKRLKHRFWTEIYQGAKLFYFSGVVYGKYPKREILNLARFISVQKFRPLTWRLNHPYLVADRFEDLTSRELLRRDAKCDRQVALYGYLRGANLRPGARVHLAGVGDFTVAEATALPDPCPRPELIKRRGLNEKERLIYGPMSDVGGLMYDKDAVYIDIPDWKVQFSRRDGLPLGPGYGAGDAGGATEGEGMVRGLQGVQEAVDERLRRSKIRLFAGSGAAVVGEESEDDDGSDAEGGSGRSGSEAGATSSDAGSDGEDSDGGSDDVSGGDWSDSEGEEEGGAGRRPRGRVGRPREVPEKGPDGRARRRAVFDETLEEAPGSDSDAEEEEEEEEEEEGGAVLEDISEGEEEEEGEEEGSDEEEDEGAASARWKDKMLERAQALFSTRRLDLERLVYGRRAIHEPSQPASSSGRQDGLSGAGGAEDDGDDFFRPLKRTAEEEDPLLARDAYDVSRPLVVSTSAGPGDDELDEEAVAELKRLRFVTGDWEAGKERGAARPEEAEAEGGEGSDEDEVFGEFEDLETGAKFGGGDDVTAAAQKAIADAAAEERRQKKLAKKAQFDTVHDEGPLPGDKGKGAGGGEGPDGKKKGAGEGGAEAEDETYYDAVRRQMTERASRTKTALDAMDEDTRVAMEGHRPGTYVRLRLEGVPCEFSECFDPRRPLLIGGLGQTELTMGNLHIRLKRHRWHRKILKNQDPLIFSVGWRRFQSVPTFAIEDHNMIRHRSLKYTPEHMHCLAVVWAPLAPPGTGVVAVQNLSSGISGWRISATGSVIEVNASSRIVKKLKLVGTPYKIARHTAFVQGMFNSQIEAAKFEGASIRTVSGIRGCVKKALRPGAQSAKPGSYRAVFEDKPLMSDIVFLRAWVGVDIPRLYNPVTDLLAAAPQREKRSKPGDKEREREAAQRAKERGQGEGEGEGWEEEAAAAPAGPSGPADLVAVEAQLKFIPAPSFSGPRKGFAFRTGTQGTGYYEDKGPFALAQALAASRKATGAAAASASAKEAAQIPPPTPGSSVTLMRTVAQLRRDQGVGAPVNVDSLYKDIERAPRKFNPLKIPKSLQAALPFKTKPKLEPARKHKTLEQRRAVVLEPEEKKLVSLVQQLNAIRNEKAKKRREQSERRRQELDKKRAKDEEWRAELKKEEKKQRYVAQERAKRAASNQGGRGKGKRQKRESGDD